MGSSSSAPELFEAPRNQYGSLFRIFKSREERDAVSLKNLSDIKKKKGEIRTQFFDMNNKRIEWIQKETKYILTNNEKLRKDIKVLIIIGAKLEWDALKNYLEHNEDFVTAFLIYHLFHYAFGIPYENILLSSSEDSNFFPSMNPNAHVSSPSKDENQKQSTPNHNLYIDNPHFTYLDTIFAQVGTDQYHFSPDGLIKQLIKPFNTYFLKQLHTTNESLLYVFYLDHSSSGYFSTLNYQYFVERLSEIETRQIIIFNQCCNSGSLIDLMDMSEYIQHIFDSNDKKENHPEIQLTQIFKKILHIAKLEKSINMVTDTNQENTDKHINQDKEEQIRSEYEEISKYLINNDESSLRKILDHLKTYQYLDDLEPINPELFIQLKQKSIIFCSCTYNMHCPTLPYREFYVGTKTRISAHGGLYSSAVIQTLLTSCKEDTDVNHFVDHLQRNFDEIGHSLKDVFIQQNTFCNDDCPEYNTEEKKNALQKLCKKSCDQFNDYLTLKFKNKETYMASSNSCLLPDLNSILLPEKYWNVDIEKVNIEDYKGIKIYNYHSLIHDVPKYGQKSDSKNKNRMREKYGPIPGESILVNFYIDFMHCLKEILSSRNITTDFNMDDDIEKHSDEAVMFADKFWGESLRYTSRISRGSIFHLRDFVLCNLDTVYKNMKDEFCDSCICACKTILPYWNDVAFNF